MYDFTHIVDFIFKKKEDYNKLSNEDKEKNFFIINRKFARGFPNHAQYFNTKGIDKASALDVWYQFFIKKGSKGIPSWYWVPKKESKNKSIVTKDDVQFLMNFYDLKEKDVIFLVEHYPEETIEEIKKYHKFENG